MTKKLKAWVIGGVLIMGIGIVLYQPFVDYFSSQASNPRGFIGSVMTKIWSNYFQDLSQWSFSHINLSEQNIILDVGFGGGANIKYIKEKNTASTVYGVDISEEAVKTATELNQNYVDSGEVILTIGDVSDLKFKDNFFDLVVATQTHIYWDSLKEGLAECHRVLRENGNLLITCEIDKIDYHLPKYKNPDDFSELLYTIGFNEVNVKISNNYIVYICTK